MPVRHDRAAGHGRGLGQWRRQAVLVLRAGTAIRRREYLQAALAAESRVGRAGAILRENLGVADDSPLGRRDFLRRFLRYDESLEGWHASSEHHRFFDSYTEPLDVLAETPPEDRFRGYQLDENAILFHGETYPLDPISRALEELQSKAEEEMQKPRFDHDV